MAPAVIREVAGENGRQAGARERRETRFERIPCTRITRSEGENPRVTVWDGVRAIVIALSFAEGNPGDTRISIVEDCLLRITAGNNAVSQTVELPCPVETRPIRIDDDKGTIYCLLRKK